MTNWNMHIYLHTDHIINATYEGIELNLAGQFEPREHVGTYFGICWGWGGFPAPEAPDLPGRQTAHHI